MSALFRVHKGRGVAASRRSKKLTLALAASAIALSFSLVGAALAGSTDGETAPADAGPSGSYVASLEATPWTASTTEGAVQVPGEDLAPVSHMFFLPTRVSGSYSFLS